MVRKYMEGIMEALEARDLMVCGRASADAVVMRPDVILRAGAGFVVTMG